MRHFLETKNVQENKNGYLRDINNKLQEYFNCQIHIFCENSSVFKIASYPAKYNPTMEQVYLLQTGNGDNGNLHYDAITNINQYFTSVKRRYCFDCGLITTIFFPLTCAF